MLLENETNSNTGDRKLHHEHEWYRCGQQKVAEIKEPNDVWSFARDPGERSYKK